MTFTNLLCKSCRAIRSKNYCLNCLKRIVKHKETAKKVRSQKAREKSELEWYSKEAKEKRLLLKLNRLTLDELANLTLD